MKPIRSLGCLLAIVASPAFAEPVYINSEEEFIQYYGFDETGPARQLTHEIFELIKPYSGQNGLAAAIAAGYIPFTAEARGHGTHWFDPRRAGRPAVSNQPAGLNFDHNGRLVAVFWSTPRSSKPLPQIFDPTLMVGFSADMQRRMLDNSKSLFHTPPPDFLNVFPGPAPEWHSHENVIIENIGAGSRVDGAYDPEKVILRQGVAPDRFFGDQVSSLRDPAVVLAPLESDPSLGYPSFNRYVSLGFHMIHMWVGTYNPDGAFAVTNPDVSPDGRDEHDTIEDPAIAGHHNHGHQHPAQVDLLQQSAAPAAVANAAVRGRFAAVKVPSGTTLCTALANGSFSVQDVATQAAVFGMVARRDLAAGTYLTKLGASLKQSCSQIE